MPQSAAAESFDDLLKNNSSMIAQKNFLFSAAADWGFAIFAHA